MPAPNTATSLTELLDWLDGVAYRDIRRAESVQTVDVTVGSNSTRPLRGVAIAPGLVLGRDKKFYRVLDGHAVVMPASLVVEQFDLKQLKHGYGMALRRQPRSRQRARK